MFIIESLKIDYLVISSINVKTIMKSMIIEFFNRNLCFISVQLDQYSHENFTGDEIDRSTFLFSSTGIYYVNWTNFHKDKSIHSTTLTIFWNDNHLYRSNSIHFTEKYCLTKLDKDSRTNRL